MVKKIALEEHFSSPMNTKLWQDVDTAAVFGPTDAQFIRENLWGNQKNYVQELNGMAIDQVVLSLNSPGVQGISDKQQAIALAKESNDAVTEAYVNAYPGRFSAFAAVALQDPQAAADELERAVTQLGMKGALINGYTNLADPDEVVYLDDPSMAVFWAKVNELNVPVYLHPRNPQPSQQRIYAGYPGLIGSAWGYTQETAVHTVRLMMSGLFDQYPNLHLILGHLGEGLSQTLPRTQARLYKQRHGQTGAKNLRPLTDYLRTNVFATTSGHFSTAAFLAALEAFGPDHMLFSLDFPYVTNEEGANWFDQLPIDDSLKEQIGYQNAAHLLNLPLSD
ncbi:amidohydrolase family protein [Levilactobacillus bambusae]|uniref:Amidohydrolase n=1 Tax=Levilactobacillus bambusae TaxID=2024736 RepID=A0A2V1N2A7_9LACO|nr:amidohydrolase family protein [Levilactobacillus bambusae]PWG00330.1 amidohydrolase [Levilactobacillus bambusae]